VRATLGYSNELPPPPRVPREVTRLEEAPQVPAPEEDDEALALSAPPAVTSEPRPSGVPAWVWAAGGALAVLLVVVPWQLAHDVRSHGGAAAATAPPAAESPPPPATQPVDRPPDEAPRVSTSAADAGTPAQAVGESARSRPRTTPAKAAGLDPNPYR
jgi:hypothetical protein